MNIKNLKTAVIITLIALPTFAIKVYQDVNMTDKNITNVPAPIVDTHAVNNEYINNLVDQLYEGTNLSVAVPAKCADAQISGYTPVAGEDLYADMQYGVDWNTNTRFEVDSTGSNGYDTLTGLMWTKNANIDGTKSWANAITYCNGLVYGGYDDWRLPNRKELLLLVDYSEYNPCLPHGHPFTAVQLDWYWSSSTSAVDTDDAWYVHLPVGLVYDRNKTAAAFVWPVRGGR